MIDPVTGLLLGSQIGGSILAGQRGQEAADDAERIRREALDLYANIPLPDTEKMRLYLEELKSAGELSPEVEQMVMLGPSSMEQIQVDPRLQGYQMDALEQVAGLAKTGLSDADMASLELIRRQAAAEDQAKQGQILQNLQARGQGGSGAELIARLQSSQGAADRIAQQGLEEARIAKASREAALRDQANLASSLRSQEFGEESSVAQAKDLINRYNAENMQRVGGRNVDRRNQAQERNLSNRQRIQDSNVGLRNQQQQYNKELEQRRYENELRRAAGMTGQMGSIADERIRRGQSEAGAIGGITQGIGTAIGSFNQGQRMNRQMDLDERRLALDERMVDSGYYKVK